MNGGLILNYTLLITMIFAALSSLFTVTRQFQMLQQNSYFPSRYYNWLKDNFPYISVFVFFISSAVFTLKLYLLQLIFITFIFGFSVTQAISLQKNSIKKNYTPFLLQMLQKSLEISVIL